MTLDRKLKEIQVATATLVNMTGQPVEVPEGDIREALPLLQEVPASAQATSGESAQGGASDPECRQTLLTVRLTHDNMTELLADVCATRYPWIGRILAEWLPDSQTGKPVAVAEVSLLLPVGMSFDDQERAFIMALGKEGRKNRDLRETVKHLHAIIDRYDTDATEVRNLLRSAGIPETEEGPVDEHGNMAVTVLGLPERVAMLANRAGVVTAG